MNRPTGVTVLAWIGIVGGALGVLGSLAGILGAVTLLTVGSLLAGPAGFLIGIDALVSTVVGLAISVLSILFGVGALSLKPSAWKLGVLIAYIDAAWAVVYAVLVLVTHPIAVIGAIIGAIISIAISLVLLWYLFTDEVRGAFGMMAEQPMSSLAPILATIDGWFGGRRGGMQPPQGTGGYQPPSAPGGYPPPPSAPGGYQPPTAPSAPAHFETPAPPQPPMPPSE
jgi:hypothetical protein